MKKYKLLFIIVVSLFIFLPHEVSAMQIFVKKLSGQNMAVEMESSDTIEAVKEKIYLLDNSFLPENQILIFNEKTLENGRTLADYNIQKGSTIHVALKIDEDVPQTLDSVSGSVIIGILSLIGLSGTAIYLKRRNKSINN